MTWAQATWKYYKLVELIDLEEIQMWQWKESEN